MELNETLKQEIANWLKNVDEFYNDETGDVDYDCLDGVYEARELLKKVLGDEQIEDIITKVQHAFAKVIDKLEDAGAGMYNADIVVDGKQCILQCYPANDCHNAWICGYTDKAPNIAEDWVELEDLTIEEQNKIIVAFEEQFIAKKSKEQIIDKLADLTCEDFTDFMRHIRAFGEYDYVAECSSSEIGKMVCYANSELGVDVKLEIINGYDYYIFGKYDAETRTYIINGLLDDYDEWSNWFDYEDLVDELTDEQIKYLMSL